MIYIIGIHCYYCEHEESFTTNVSSKREREAFEREIPSVCPSCHRVLVKKDGYYLASSQYSNASALFSQMKPLRKPEEDAARTECQQISQEYVEKSKTKNEKIAYPGNADNDIVESGHLKDYIRALIRTYGLIYYLQGRLADLLYLRKRNGYGYEYDRTELRKKIEANKVAKIEAEIKKEEGIIRNYRKGIVDISDAEIVEAGIVMPAEPVPPKKLRKKPVTLPAKPVAPDYKGPGFFHRLFKIPDRKIQEHNDFLRSQYERSLAEYEKKTAEYQQYTDKIQAYDEKMAEYENQKLIYYSEMNEYESKVQSLRKERGYVLAEDQKKVVAALTEELRKSKKEAAKEIGKLISCYPSYIVDRLLSGQIRDIQKHIDETTRKLYELYSYEIIYPKYRDYVSICSFYEYLESGRCDSLGGPYGAYNLYESDIKAKLILEKLNLIIENLEKIKENQHIIYSELTVIESDLQEMNSLLEDIVSLLDGTSSGFYGAIGTLEDIQDLPTVSANTVAAIEENPALNAYYNAENEYWSRKNAELEDSLGLLIALKR